MKSETKKSLAAIGITLITGTVAGIMFFADYSAKQIMKPLLDKKVIIIKTSSSLPSDIIKAVWQQNHDVTDAELGEALKQFGYENSESTRKVARNIVNCLIKIEKEDSRNPTHCIVYPGEGTRIININSNNNNSKIGADDY